jgi:hypothetical protein
LPKTILIPWDVLDHHSDEKPTIYSLVAEFPSSPALLKAPMGSGGFGIYFVYHIDDVIEVLRNHRLRAEKDSTFMASINHQYSKEDIQLCWSLQELVQPIRCFLPRNSYLSSDLDLVEHKTQVRAYVVALDGNLFLYRELETRCPLWDIDLDLTLTTENELNSRRSHSGDRPVRSQGWSDSVEEECCGKGHARPYNEQRNKRLTKRYLLRELPELVPSIHCVLSNVQVCMATLRPLLLEEAGQEAKTLGIIGIDLLVSHGSKSSDYEVKLVEVNNNPAMPQEDRSMSSAYRQHLATLQKSLIALSLTSDGSYEGSRQLHDLAPELEEIWKSYLDNFALIPSL